jgi:hypothetical protein
VFKVIGLAPPEEMFEIITLLAPEKMFEIGLFSSKQVVEICSSTSEKMFEIVVGLFAAEKVVDAGSDTFRRNAHVPPGKDLLVNTLILFFVLTIAI